ncbi:MAG: 2-C-methyl-D-erythritol 4-phosphate cytidylyltransferase [Gammaproteobacteria bacterium]|nr:2-C-methyl-D-erythritol 4-phosphate cytidylyltransferase [Gammaproteobacteria bacterium]
MRFWFIVPAAGVGRRMGGVLPKQYLKLGEQTIIEHTLYCLRNHPAISGVVLVISPTDQYWPQLHLPEYSVPLWVAEGGVERCHSVLNGLYKLQERAADDDWVLVHDAARPCLRADDIDKLINNLQTHAVGGLLGLPVADTIKQVDESGMITKTVDRCGLWRALTPQMFRLGLLREALNNALSVGYIVTDEASAMEFQGYRPMMIEGAADNIKMTHPNDLSLVKTFLQQQGRAI